MNEVETRAEHVDPALAAGWNEVGVSTPLLEPGLFVVSVNVVSTVSFSTITETPTFAGVAPSASPSVLVLVAGSYTTLTTTSFPGFVYFDTAQNIPNGYFWLDVLFTPVY